jgi:hypothetical protein
LPRQDDVWRKTPLPTGQSNSWASRPVLKLRFVGYDTSHYLDYIASNDGKIDESESIWKKSVAV